MKYPLHKEKVKAAVVVAVAEIKAAEAVVAEVIQLHL
jgi:hypothetical protein